MVFDVLCKRDFNINYTFMDANNSHMSEATLTIHIQNKKPVDLFDLTESLQAVARQYQKFLEESEEYSTSDATRLYVQEVKSGSIIIILKDLVPAIIPYSEYVNSVLKFIEFIKEALDYLSSKTDQKPKEFDEKDLKNLYDIVNIVAKDNGSQMNFIGNFDNLTINAPVLSTDGNAAQNGITRERIINKTPIKMVHEKVLFYWDSTKYDSKSSKSIDRGRIDDLADNALKVSFNDESMKSEMIDLEENPYHFMFIVDVEVHTVNKMPALYKILKVHDKIEKD